MMNEDEMEMIINWHLPHQVDKLLAAMITQLQELPM
jgi:hypothetical protein